MISHQIKLEVNQESKERNIKLTSFLGNSGKLAKLQLRTFNKEGGQISLDNHYHAKIKNWIITMALKISLIYIKITNT